MGRKRFVLLLSFILLVSVLLVVSFSLLRGHISDDEVLNIATKYVEEKYGTDYVRNGNVTETTFSNNTGSWVYPSASFRVPADWQEPGTIVTVMVNPQTGEIFQVLTNWSKSMPPTS